MFALISSVRNINSMSNTSFDEDVHYDYFNLLNGLNIDAVDKEKLALKSNFIISFLPVIIVIGVIGKLIF